MTIEKATYTLYRSRPMLTAAKKRKIKRRIARAFREDEITSIVFEPLVFLDDPNLTWHFFQQFIEVSGHSFSLGSNPTDVEFEFWPKFVPAFANSGIRDVEPDMVVHFTTPHGKIHIILEFKWITGNGQPGRTTPPCELLKQWVHRDQRHDDKWLHLYITRRAAISNGNAQESCTAKFNESTSGAINSCEMKECSYYDRCHYKFPPRATYIGAWKNCLFPATWKHVLLAASRLEYMCSPHGEPVDGHGWGQSVVAFLEQSGIVPFIGFSKIEPDTALHDISETSFFTTNPWFTSLEQNVCIDPTDTNFYQSGDNK